MSFPELDPTVGGIIEMHYSQPSLGPIYPIRLAVTTFSTVPSGASNDYLYTGAGAFQPDETGVIATFAAVAACWASYYANTWTLVLAGLWRNQDGGAVPLDVVPSAATVQGSDGATYPAGSVVKRSIGLYSTGGSLWRAWLRQLPAQLAGQSAQVSANSGGLDARDQAWYSYIAAGRSALCGRDGLPLQAGGKVRSWWDTPPAPYVVSG